MPKKRSNIDVLGQTPEEREGFLKAVTERPEYGCPICVRLGLNIKAVLYNRLELYGHLRLHKLDDLRDELVRAITGEGGR